MEIARRVVEKEIMKDSNTIQTPKNPFSDPVTTFRSENSAKKDLQVHACLSNQEQVINLKELRQLASSRYGLLSISNRQQAWPKMVAAHLVIWGDTSSSSLHHPTPTEVTDIRKLVSITHWESKGLSASEQHALSATSSRRVRFQLPQEQVAFSTKRKQDRKILRKILVHLKRTCPHFRPNQGTCCAIALLSTVLESAPLASLVVQQLVSYHWTFHLQEKEQHFQENLLRLLKLCNTRLFRCFASFGKIPSVIRESWIPSWFAQSILDTALVTRIWDVLLASDPYCFLYVCVSLVTEFETILFPTLETDNEWIELSNVLLLNQKLAKIPNLLDATTTEIVLDRALHWMKEYPQSKIFPRTSSTAEPPAWFKATTVPTDWFMLEHSKRIRANRGEKFRERNHLESSSIGSSKVWILMNALFLILVIGIVTYAPCGHISTLKLQEITAFWGRVTRKLVVNYFGKDEVINEETYYNREYQQHDHGSALEDIYLAEEVFENHVTELIGKNLINGELMYDWSRDDGIQGQDESSFAGGDSLLKSDSDLNTDNDEFDKNNKKEADFDLSEVDGQIFNRSEKVGQNKDDIDFITEAANEVRDVEEKDVKEKEIEDDHFTKDISEHEGDIRSDDELMDSVLKDSRLDAIRLVEETSQQAQQASQMAQDMVTKYMVEIYASKQKGAIDDESVVLNDNNDEHQTSTTSSSYKAISIEAKKNSAFQNKGHKIIKEEALPFFQYKLALSDADVTTIFEKMMQMSIETQNIKKKRSMMIAWLKGAIQTIFFALFPSLRE